MSKYYTEGTIKNVTVEGSNVSFTLDPIAPYVFEKKNDGGSTERCLLFVNEGKNADTAQIIKTDAKFKAPKPADFQSLIIAKANRMRVKICVQKLEKQQSTLIKMEI